MSNIAPVEAKTSVEPKNSFTEIKGLYEPSGVIQLDDGRLLTIEDEPTSPFLLLKYDKSTNRFLSEKLRPANSIVAITERFGDLEGLAKGPGEYIFAITSHSRSSNGKRKRQREKIARFSISENRIDDARVRHDFYKSLVKAYPVLKAASKKRSALDNVGLNIEGLTFGPDKKVLWVGLRSPLFDTKAILVSILNPHAAFSNNGDFHLPSELQLLDLDGGGIRDIVYDPRLSGYLIISQKEGTKKEKKFKLWLWSGLADNAPQRVKIAGVSDLERAEGITSVKFGKITQILLLSDDGNRIKQKAASYLLVNYTDLEFEE